MGKDLFRANEKETQRKKKKKKVERESHVLWGEARELQG